VIIIMLCTSGFYYNRSDKDSAIAACAQRDNNWAKCALLDYFDLQF